MCCTENAEPLFRVERLTFFYERKGAARSLVIQTALIIRASFLHTQTAPCFTCCHMWAENISDHSGLDTHNINKPSTFPLSHTTKLKTSPHFVVGCNAHSLFPSAYVSICRSHPCFSIFVPNLSHTTSNALTGNCTQCNTMKCWVHTILRFQKLLQVTLSSWKKTQLKIQSSNWSDFLLTC